MIIRFPAFYGTLELEWKEIDFSKFPPLHIRIAYKEHLFDIIEACDINSYKNRELAEIQCKEVQKKWTELAETLTFIFF